ncbi:hypothetical protein NDA18_000740 [Ustilago nuda]|nr:hypothetical protein NDA18_000740 [Ustilago nuda]
MSAHDFAEIHRIVSSIRDVLPLSARLEKEDAKKDGIFTTPLHLEHHSSAGIQNKLSEYALGEKCLAAILHIFDSTQRRLAKVYHEEYLKGATALSKTREIDEEYLGCFARNISRYFSRGVCRLEETLVAIVMSELKTTGSRRPFDVESFPDVSAMARQDTTSKRGHDTDAVRILEQAFQHTPNITQAEKYRLAEVTGLKPKQVTIWFQNRRNRKSRRGSKTEPTTPPQHFDPHPEQPHTPTRDFTLSEKKRKTYGALGRGSPSLSFSDSDDSSLNLKKPRLPRACSTTSEASASSLELGNSFTSWGSTSSRSTSSSSTSSSQSDCFDSPGRAHNVFRLIDPLKYEGHAKQDMPAITMATPPQATYAGVGQEQRSPFTSDNVNLSNVSQHQQLGFHTNSSEIKLNFGDLQFNQEALHKGLRESIQKALDISAMRQASERSASGSSWAKMDSTTTDDNGWVDEDEAPVPPFCNTPVDQTAIEQRQQPSFGLSFLQNQPSSQLAGGSTSTDSSFSLADKTDFFDLNQFFETAASAPASFLPSSSPFFPHQQYSPPAPLVHTAPPIAGGMDAPNSCLDFEVEMSDIQDYLNSSFLAPALIQPSMAGVDGEGAIAGGSQTQVQEGEAPAQFYLNFDLGPEMFSFE